MAENKTLSLGNVYNYRNKLKNWKAYATRNKIPFNCEKCHKTHAHKTVLLETGEHICWYCWIHRDAKLVAVQKPISIIKVSKPVKQTKEKISKSPVAKTEKPSVEKKMKITKKEKTIANSNVKIDAAKKPSKIIKKTEFANSLVIRKANEIAIIGEFNDGFCEDVCECKIHAESLKILDEPIVQKYFRLTEQAQNEKFSLFQKTSKVTRGICSFDKNANYAIEMLDIHKSFLNGKVIANDGIDLRVKHNEIHAIIGENGAGKSTLMSVLFGIYSPDRGIIKVNGEQVFFSSAKDASKAGLGMVHQHFKLVPTYTVLENVILGSEMVNEKLKYLDVIDTKTAQDKIQTLIDKYHLNINLNTKVSKLTVGQQQKTEILKLLYRDARILIFDEPTAVLSPDEITQFLKMVTDLRDEGKTIIIITHKFNEIKTIADRATIIRLGTFISDFSVHERTIQEMATEMVGREVVEVVNEDHKFKKNVILDINNLTLKLKRNASKETNPINLQIHAGEIYAIAGVEGNGQSELVMAISGLEKKFSGSISIQGVDITSASVYKRNELGLSHIPENRHRHGLILDLPIYMNVVLNSIDTPSFSKFGILNEKEIKEYTRSLIKKFDVRGSVRGTSPARGLSGGNQQKLIVARELSHGNKLIIMMQPTRGLDLGAVKYIHEKILEGKRKGNAILLVSYELDEILSLADTIAVMSNGSLLAVGNTRKMSRNKIGQLMAGKA